MKLRWKIAVGFATAGAVCAFFLLRSSGREQRAVEETRRALRQQGFKVDLTEFDFSTSAEFQARAADLTATSEFRRSRLLRTTLDFLPAVGSNAAIVVWKQDNLPSYSGEDRWPALRETLDESRAELDAACKAALAGPIRFSLVAGQGNAMLLPHLAALRNLTQTLSGRAMLELHDQNKDAAWTNLLACCRLVTAWDPEPAEPSHLVHEAWAAMAYNACWQALQAEIWADDRLANLQHEWESVDFFKGFPDTAAFARASMVADCRLERQQRLGPGIPPKDILRSPRWALTEYLRQLRYRRHGTYEDEKALLLFFRDRELELRRAVQCSTWSEMRQLPGVTNMVHFESMYSPRMQSMMNARRSQSFQRLGKGLLGQAAEAEARRRLVVTAIALERYRGRHGSYPKMLQELVPDLLKNPPTDFMDGKPLRYCLTEGGRFILYSVGLDCIDNGGQMRRQGRERGDMPFEEFPPFGAAQPADLVWPRPASAAEVKAQQGEEERARQEARRRAESHSMDDQ